MIAFLFFLTLLRKEFSLVHVITDALYFRTLEVFDLISIKEEVHE